MAAKLRETRSAFTVSIRRRSRLRHSRPNRALVDRIPVEPVELVGEQIRGSRRVARWERRRVAVELDAHEPLGRLVLDLDLPLEPGAQPPPEQVRLSQRPRDPDLLHL